MVGQAVVMKHMWCAAATKEQTAHKHLSSSQADGMFWQPPSHTLSNTLYHARARSLLMGMRYFLVCFFACRLHALTSAHSTTSSHRRRYTQTVTTGTHIPTVTPVSQSATSQVLSVTL